MKPFVVYDLETGLIVSSGYAPEEHLNKVAGEGKKAIWGKGTAGGHYVDLATETIRSRESPQVVLTREAEGAMGTFVLSNLPADSEVVVSLPKGGRTAPIPVDANGQARFTPEEPGRHLARISSVSTTSKSIPFDATLPAP